MLINPGSRPGLHPIYPEHEKRARSKACSDGQVDPGRMNFLARISFFEKVKLLPNLMLQRKKGISLFLYF